MLGHVADQLADARALGGGVQVEDACLALGRRQQAEQDLDQRALAGAVGADEADDARLEVHGQAIERGDAGVTLRQRPGADEGHARTSLEAAARAAAGYMLGW